MKYTRIFLLMLFTFAACDDLFIADKEMLDRGKIQLPPVPLGEWGTPASLSASVSTAQDPRIAHDGFGNAMAVWAQSVGTSYHIYASHYSPAAGTWQSAMRIDDVDDVMSGYGWAPDIAMDTVGNAIVVWKYVEGSTVTIYSKKYYAQSGWQSTSWGEQIAIAGPALYVDNPRIAMDSHGNAIVLYTAIPSGSQILWATRYFSSIGWIAGGWGPALPIETGVNSVYENVIAIDRSGNAHVVWRQWDGTRNAIRASIYYNTGTWGETSFWRVPETIDGGSGDGSIPQVAVDDAGNAMIVWQTAIGSETNIYANRYKTGTGWEGARAIESGAGMARMPHVAFDKSGNAIAVWAQHDGSRFNIYANRFLAAKTWATGWNPDAVLIEQENEGDASYPRVAFDSAGYAFAVWELNDGYNHIRWNRYVPQSNLLTAWGTTGIVETNPTVDGRDPRFVITTNGEMIAVWEQLTPASQTIMANVYR